MRKNNVLKSVSFNTTKSDDAKMLKAVKRKNFSGYMKKLLMADIIAKELEDAQSNSSSQPITKVKEQLYPINQSQEEPLTTTERLEEMKKQLKKTGNGASQPKSFINHQ